MYTTNQRKDGGADDHRAQLVFDWGLSRRLTWTVNGGLEYRNLMNIGGDRKGGRFATDFEYRLFELEATGAAERSIRMNFSGEWKALTNSKPYYKGQFKITMPLFEGVSLPIAWAYETKTLENIGTNNRVKFSLGFDPGKLSTLFR